ncbi:hypothetical protein GCM10027169_12520 [Gordonia jinhuaensis]|uniref:Uncharacterized protein n=1 Tax=Gordonia jinhuaensis TaxID=1517702 RepID=A0A916WQ51_9ACTN|nr:hypothetical protein GCM10011489_07850 [Gordonia jinhuaensis]
MVTATIDAITANAVSANHIRGDTRIISPSAFAVTVSPSPEHLDARGADSVPSSLRWPSVGVDAAGELVASVPRERAPLELVASV